MRRRSRPCSAGDAQAFAAMQADYGYGPLVVAVGEAADGNFVTRLAGTDSVGPHQFRAERHDSGGDAKDGGARRRRDRLRHHRESVEGTARSGRVADRGELRAGAEPAPERRRRPPTATAEVPRNVVALVEFSGLKDWQDIRGRLMKVAGHPGA